MDRLRAVRDLRDALNSEEARLLAAARKEGIDWKQIIRETATPFDKGIHA